MPNIEGTENLLQKEDTPIQIRRCIDRRLWFTIVAMERLPIIFKHPLFKSECSPKSKQFNPYKKKLYRLIQKAIMDGDPDMFVLWISLKEHESMLSFYSHNENNDSKLKELRDMVMKIEIAIEQRIRL